MTERSDMAFSVLIRAGARTLVDCAEYRLPQQRIMLLFGESGIGKSLINRAVYGLLDPEQFEVTVNGCDASAWGAAPWVRSIQQHGFFVFQEPSTHLHPLLTLGEQLREGSLADSATEGGILAELWGGADGSSPRPLLDVYPKPYRPSGGEKQRMLLAMAFKKIDLFQKRGRPDVPTLFMFDEPTGSLDNRFRDVVLHMLFARYRRMPFTAVVISHDYSMISMIRRDHPDLAGEIVYRELALEQGRVVLRDFEPQTYLDWIARQQPPRAAQESGTLTARVESDVQVFGRKLMLVREPRSPVPSPLELRRGAMAYLKAPSGMGKTTLVKMMMGLVRGDRFRMTLGKSTVSERTTEDFWRRRVWGRSMTMVFQHADEALNPRATVHDTFRGLPARRSPGREQVLRILGELFDPAVAASILDREVANLSGGQKQRLNLLRGLSLETGLIILDEPLNGLDFESSVRVLGLLRERLRHGDAILVISHSEEIFDSQVAPDGTVYLIERA